MAALLVGLAGCRGGFAGKAETVRLGALPGGSATLMYIAQERNFFSHNGLDVILKDDYPSGVATTAALLKGDIDIAWTAEYPLVARAFDKNPLSIIGGTGRFTTEFLIARKDRGIATLSDIKGRNIGVAVDTIAEFYLKRFLTLNDIDPHDLTLVDVAASQAQEQVINGILDGAVSTDPYISQIQKNLGDGAITWPIQGNQPGYGLLVARNDWISASADVMNKFLKSLVQAEDYLVNDPADAKSLVQKRLDIDDVSFEAFWSEIQAFVSLDQSIILAMEDEARWMIENKLTSAQEVPDFLDYIQENALKAIKPQAVNIIR
jgi:NitT/TauT family transport system substrate-binding protein